MTRLSKAARAMSDVRFRSLVVELDAAEGMVVRRRQKDRFGKFSQVKDCGGRVCWLRPLSLCLLRWFVTPPPRRS